MPAGTDPLRLPDDVIVFPQEGWPHSRELAAQLGLQDRLVKVGRVWVPAAFQLDVMLRDEVDSANPSLMITLMYLVDDGELVLAQVLAGGIEVHEAIDFLRKRRPMGWWKRYALVALTGDVAEHGADMANNLLMNASTDEDSEGPGEAYWRERERIIADAVLEARTMPLARRRNRITGAHLAEVARVYREAHSAGHPPTQAVADHFHKSHSTAARWVGLARKTGQLGQADGSRGGER